MCTAGAGSLIAGRTAGLILWWRVHPSDAHKQDPRNLWLNTARIDRQGRFIVDFSIPPGTHDVRFVDLVEVERQAGIVFAHRCLGVADDAEFVLSDISLQLSPDIRWQSRRGLSGTIQVSVADPHATAIPLRRATMDFSIRIHGQKSGRGRAIVRFLPAKLYARIREKSLASTTHLPENAWPKRPRQDAVIVDTRDSLIEDHSADHVPGMAIAAAIERVAADLDERALRGLSLTFREYLEHSLPTVLCVESVHDGEMQGTVQQAGVTKAVFSGLMNTHGNQ